MRNKWFKFLSQNQTRPRPSIKLGDRWSGSPVSPRICVKNRQNLMKIKQWRNSTNKPVMGKFNLYFWWQRPRGLHKRLPGQPQWPPQKVKPRWWKIYVESDEISSEQRHTWTCGVQEDVKNDKSKWFTSDQMGDRWSGLPASLSKENSSRTCDLCEKRSSGFCSISVNFKWFLESNHGPV